LEPELRDLPVQPQLQLKLRDLLVLELLVPP
jgi:hypothetical protein